MRTSTRSLLVAFGSAAALVVAPLALDHAGESAQAPLVSTESVTVPAEPAQASETSEASETSATEPELSVREPAQAPETFAAEPDPVQPGSGMGGDLPPSALPVPPYPECPITGEGAWWTDPADPYTCIRPGSIPFFEPTPPGIAPELLEPIFEEPGAEPGPGDDCRVVGALQCTVTIMGADYVVTFFEGKPVGVAEVRE